ncbi:DUF5819 family protein [Streptomyces sp. CMB-StM0423]|uniref:DUF5819 family protein n=1 Tax=Streptomyces sp. CMB-StM0423 TaxID=2059884 RepID=UPI000C712064|nr:DUF5819 family protein [Streptomyces sp. CMB-StM0423]AUH41833.1 hypothetical protein CXR04_17900 [Streptomyces sp. CMB-StM0423]
MESRQPDKSRAGIPDDGGVTGAEAAAPAEPAEGEPAAAPRPVLGIAGLSPLSRIIVALAIAVLVGVVTVHLGAGFLHVAPANTLSKKHDETIDRIVFPEFEQNWRLFAPNPLQTNIHVEVRAQLLMPEGGTEETGWVDLTAMDHENIEGNPAPSHTVQNELRRGWDYWTDTHDEDNRAISDRADLAEDYVKRIVMRRLGPVLNDGRVEKIQLRQTSRRIAPPPWSSEQWDTAPVYRELPWWIVTGEDLMKSDRVVWEGSTQ